MSNAERTTAAPKMGSPTVEQALADLAAEITATGIRLDSRLSSFEGDVIVYHRPADMDAETWEQVKAESRQHFAISVEEARA